MAVNNEDKLIAQMVYITPFQKERLDDLSGKSHRSQADIVREALSVYFNLTDQPTNVSAQT
jgi:predicted DNA-binding protein